MSPRQKAERAATVGYGRGMALGLCATALLLMGCVSNQVTAVEGGGSDGLAETGDVSPSSNLLGFAQVLPVAAEVELGGEVIGLEVTRTQEEQATGLMYRSRLADDRGMLFSFSPAQPVRFWMKNVVIDLDMVFVHGGKVVGIAADVPPCEDEPCETYGPGFGVLVDEVIELRGGRAAELGLAVGDEVVVRFLED